MTIKSLFGNRAVYVAMMDIRMDMVVTRAAYRIPQDNLLYIIKNIKPNHMYTENSLQIIFIQAELKMSL